MNTTTIMLNNAAFIQWYVVPEHDTSRPEVRAIVSRRNYLLEQAERTAEYIGELKQKRIDRGWKPDSLEIRNELQRAQMMVSTARGLDEAAAIIAKQKQGDTTP